MSCEGRRCRGCCRDQGWGNFIRRLIRLLLGIWHLIKDVLLGELWMGAKQKEWKWVAFCGGLSSVAPALNSPISTSRPGTASNHHLRAVNLLFRSYLLFVAHRTPPTRWVEETLGRLQLLVFMYWVQAAVGKSRHFRLKICETFSCVKHRQVDLWYPAVNLGFVFINHASLASSHTNGTTPPLSRRFEGLLLELPFTSILIEISVILTMLSIPTLLNPKDDQNRSQLTHIFSTYHRPLSNTSTMIGIGKSWLPNLP